MVRGIDEEIGASASRRFDSRETLSWHLVTPPEQYSLLSPLGFIGRETGNKKLRVETRGVKIAPEST